jgi:hypothetical protein
VLAAIRTGADATMGRLARRTGAEEYEDEDEYDVSGARSRRRVGVDAAADRATCVSSVEELIVGMRARVGTALAVMTVGSTSDGITGLVREKDRGGDERGGNYRGGGHSQQIPLLCAREPHGVFRGHGQRSLWFHDQTLPNSAPTRPHRPIAPSHSHRRICAKPSDGPNHARREAFAFLPVNIYTPHTPHTAITRL